MPIYNPRWNKLGSFNSGGASSFMANAGRNLSIATDTSIYKDRAKKDFLMYQTQKKEEFDAQTGDIIARIMNGQQPEAMNGNFDHKAVALAISEKKKVDYKHARDLISDDQWERKYRDDVNYRQAMLKNTQAQLTEASRHNMVTENISKYNAKEQTRRDTLNYNLGVGRLKEQTRSDTLNYNLGVGRLNEQITNDKRNYNLGVGRLREQQRSTTLNYNLGVERLKEQTRSDTLNYNLGVGRLNEQIANDTRSYNLGVSRLKEQVRNDNLNYNLGVDRLQEQRRGNTLSYNLGVGKLNEQQLNDKRNYNLGIARLEEQKNQRVSSEMSQIYLGKKVPNSIYDYTSGYVTKDVVTHKAGSYTDEGKKTLDMIHLKEKDRNKFLSLSKDEQKKEARKYWQKIIDNPKSKKENVEYAKKVLGEKNLFDKTVDVLGNAMVDFNEATDNFKADIYGFFTKDSTKEANKQQIKKYYDRTRKELGLTKSPTGNAVNEYMRTVIEKPLEELTSKAEKQKYYENVVEQMRVPATKVEMATQALKNAIDSNADNQTIEKLKGFLYSAKEDAKKRALEFSTKVQLENMKKRNKIEEIGYRYQTNKKILDYKKKLKQDD